MKAENIHFLHPFKKQKKDDLFKRTQLRLTLLYSGLLMIFLILFIIVVYALLYSTIFKDQERELETRVNQEAKGIEMYLSNLHQSDLSEIQAQQSVVQDVDQFFYYIVNRSGQLVSGNERIPDLRPELLRTVKGWQASPNEIRKKTLNVTFSGHGPKGKERREGKSGKPEFEPIKRKGSVRLMISGHPIISNGERVGTVYIGKEVSFAYQLFNWLLIILSGLAVLFLGVALIISYFMSKKAMVPITHAFSRQREFVADASHELRTPLSVMLSSINAMEMILESDEEDYSHKLLFNMKNEVNRMTGLVGDLLTLARSDSGSVELIIEKFDFRLAAQKALDAVGALAESKQIKLTITAPETLLIHGDSQKLTQLLYILLDNAIKYTPNGGEANLTLSLHEKDLLITMKDTGIGIFPEDRSLIFERFYRSDKSRSRQAGGHGLGLAIAKWIAESHGGTIQVMSEIGKGSEFSVSLPFING
ncbi:His Kinase A (phospho-acceptor) domain-containing protein [Bacillus sp. OV322]|uniref:ATP-binding protein n=1 Tax=Bacillus sp. OV322 TaxID=1882764 RepID=UPI0008ED164E|nr:ATP-binding protein [Bacillus sp. OV322]SFC87662.1 His Kinase A (phospho-acceptor) domain-containing protein [Bacillus sp. OV322]